MGTRPPDPITSLGRPCVPPRSSAEIGGVRHPKRTLRSSSTVGINLDNRLSRRARPRHGIPPASPCKTGQMSPLDCIDLRADLGEETPSNRNLDDRAKGREEQAHSLRGNPPDPTTTSSASHNAVRAPSGARSLTRAEYPPDAGHTRRLDYSTGPRADPPNHASIRASSIGGSLHDYSR